MLRHVPLADDSRILVGTATRDDAAVFRLTDNRAVVATVDFFTPIVDDAYAFGAIAAANAFSDIYAMGATPLFALNLVGWPRDPQMLELLGDTLRGGGDVARKAGAFVLGGHSIDDKEPKYGMVAFGEVHPDHLLTNAGARVGDALVLTKPLGTGILSTALKRDLITESSMAPAVNVMTTLNAGAAEAMRALGETVHAATDVTGFGLLGHLGNLLDASGVSAVIHANAVPVFDGVADLIRKNVVPGGTTRNIEAADGFTRWGSDLTDVDRTVLSDAQTSGGLLIAVASSRVADLVEELRARETPVAAVVGEVVEKGARQIEVVAQGTPASRRERADL